MNINAHWEWMNPAKPKDHRMLIMNGVLTSFKYQLKEYVRPCCLYAYNIGSRNLCLSDADRRALGTKLKVKAAKYVLTEGKTFEVYELVERRKERVKVDYDKDIEVTRHFMYNEYREPYQLMTKAEYNRYQKALQKKEQPKVVPAANTSGDSSSDESTIEYVYLIQDRTAAVANEPIYKIGKTSQKNFDRFKSYPKGYRVLLHISTKNCDRAEKEIIGLFKNKYTQVADYGSEYFRGSSQAMMVDICDIAFNQ